MALDYIKSTCYASCVATICPILEWKYAPNIIDGLWVLHEEPILISPQFPFVPHIVPYPLSGHLWLRNWTVTCPDELTRVLHRLPVGTEVSFRCKCHEGRHYPSIEPETFKIRYQGVFLSYQEILRLSLLHPESSRWDWLLDNQDCFTNNLDDVKALLRKEEHTDGL